MNIVELITSETPAKMTGNELIEKLSSIKLTKSNAVQILALASAIGKITDDAKQYLLSLQSAASGSFTDPSTGLTMQVSSAMRTTVSNKKIEKLKADIKKEEALVKKGINEGSVETVEYKRWTLVKS